MKLTKISLFVISGLMAMNALADVPAANEFKAENIFAIDSAPIKNLRQDHPRLLANKDDFKKILDRAKTDPVMQDVVNEIIRRADSRMFKAPEVFKMGANDASPSLLDPARRAINVIIDNAMAWRLTKDKHYANRVIHELTAISDFPHWNAKYRFLDAAEMMFAIAIGYDWVWDAMSPAQRKEIEDALYIHGVAWGEKAYDLKNPKEPSLGFPWWATNWNEVCNGGVLAASLAIADKYPEVTKKLINNIVPSLKMDLKAYAPDGASAEGPVYWSYGMNYRVLSIAMLQSALGSNFGLTDDPILAKAALYRYGLEAPSGNGFNYADGIEDMSYTPAYSWLGEKFNNEDIKSSAKGQMLKALETSKSNKAWGEFDRFFALFPLWYPQPKASTATKGSETKLVFKGPAELFVYKRDNKDPKSLWLATKGGTNTANHAHMDLGTFVMEMNGVRWAIDFGKDRYNLPGYFDLPQRASYYRISALSHNTVTFDGKNQDLNGFAPLTMLDKEKGASINLTQAWPNVADSIVRTFKVVDNAQAVEITDTVKNSLADQEYRWAMVTRADVKLNGKEAILTQDGQQLRARIMSEGAYEFSLVSTTPPGDERQYRNEGTQMLAVKSMLKKGSDNTVTVKLGN